MRPNPPTSPDPAVLRDLEERLRSRMNVLEDQNARMQRRIRLMTFVLLSVVALLGAVAVAPGLIGAVRQGEALDVRSLRLVDDRGDVRAEWGVDTDGATRMSLHDQQGRQRLNLSVLRTGFPGIALINEAGQRRAVLGLLPDQTTTLVFADARGTPRAVLGLTNVDAANLVFADADGVSRLGMGLDGSGLASVMMPPDSALQTTLPGGDR
jgi:hypothetical protein